MSCCLSVVHVQAYRIDHILGFFRIWEIPGDGVTGLLGKFSPAIPLHRNELEGRGIWDMDRLTQPYIRDWIIDAVCGDLAAVVREQYLDHHEHGVWTFKQHYANEQALQASTTEPELLRCLKVLITNVVLISDGNGWSYHPRIDMMRTSSFAELPDEWKASLKELYIDYFYKRQEGLWRQVRCLCVKLYRLKPCYIQRKGFRKTSRLVREQ